MSKVATYLEDPRTRQALKTFEKELADLPNSNWNRASLAATANSVLEKTGFKMRELAMPVRIIVTGREQTPAIDAVLELIGRETVLARLSHHLDSD